MGHTLILTGRSGIGKTTIIKAVIAQLGDRAGGFYTEEILGPGGRKGFRLITLDGQSAVIAHIDFKSRSQVGRYDVKVDVIDNLGAGAIRAAIDHNPIVIIDEIGKMELFSSQFQSAVLKAVSSSKVVLATAMLDNHPWLLALKSLPQVTVWEVNKPNRTRLVEQVLAWLPPQT
ncbi:nucleoside-triphosphatase [Thermoflexales bacterium]|nr:nucleoside-triphosphatase [Thermoflexales bacterium]